MHCFTVLGARSQSQGGSGPRSLWRCWGRNCLVPLSCLLAASGIPWLTDVSLQFHGCVLPLCRHIIFPLCVSVTLLKCLLF